MLYIYDVPVVYLKEDIMARPKKNTEVPKRTRKVRSYEERLAEYDKKIRYHEAAIAALRTKKEKMQNPPMSREDKKAIITAAAQSGLSLAEIKARLANQI